MLIVQGRKIFKDGEPIQLRGWNYAPIPIGFSSGRSWAKEPAQLAADVIDMRQAGANCIRVYYDDFNAAEYASALALCHANGLQVLMFYYIPTAVDYSEATGSSNRNAVISAATAMVTNLKDQPAIIGWGIGNEVNYNLGVTPKADYYSLLNATIGACKAIDATRLYTTANGEVADVYMFDGIVPNIDVWGLNIYRARTFNNLLAEAIRSTKKPIILTEYGYDSWNSATNSEDQAGQASRLVALMTEVENYFPYISGHLLFEWADEWWKMSTPSTHSTTGVAGADDRDGYLNEEWFGVTQAATPGASQARIKKQAYLDIKAYASAHNYGALPSPRLQV